MRGNYPVPPGLAAIFADERVSADEIASRIMYEVAADQLRAGPAEFPLLPMVMGYYQRNDIPIHFLLADAFTMCDGCHCSLLGGTLPNRLYWLSATINPEGDKGGPQLGEPGFLPLQQYSWTIMPDNLEAAGVSWKVYQNKDAGRFINTPISNNGLVQAFKQSADPRSNLARFGISPTYPQDFAADVAANIPNVVLGTTDGALPSIPYRVPFPQTLPTQETSPVRGIPSGVC
jgi:phospholipase C